MYDDLSDENATEAVFEPYKPKIKKEWNRLRDDDKRPPLRGAVHTKSQQQAHLQECVRQDTRGMRGKARRADKDDESRNRRDEETSVKRITKEGRPRTVALQYLGCGNQRIHL